MAEFIARAPEDLAGPEAGRQGGTDECGLVDARLTLD
jgi:hypothetical protein